MTNLLKQKRTILILVLTLLSSILACIVFLRIRKGTEVLTELEAEEMTPVIIEADQTVSDLAEAEPEILIPIDSSVKMPVFSAESGFYDESFTLTILAEEGVRVFYTLDGSDPDIDSAEYTQPLLIEDASKNENIWSVRNDTSVWFYDDMVKFGGFRQPRYKSPDTLIDKCTILKAVCIREDGICSGIKTASFFVDYGEKKGYEGMNILSLVTDPDNLFNYHDGIYITGEKYDEEKDSINTILCWAWPSNYMEKGKESERTAVMQLFDADGNLTVSKTIGIRIQGRASRTYLPKSLNLYARKEYDGAPFFPESIFDDGYAPQCITLFAGGNNYLVKLNDFVMHSLVADRAFSTKQFKPCALFLDGEYWGVYWLTEKYDENFIAEHYGVKTGNIVMIKEGEIEVGRENDIDLYTEMKEFITNNDMSLPENYARATELIDIDSYIDYYASFFFIARHGDWPGYNYALWRTRSIRDDKYSDGRWRWMLYDVNGESFEIKNVDKYGIKRLEESDAMFSSLMTNKEFERRFYSTLLEIANENFSPEKTALIIEEFRNTMTEALKKEYIRFYGEINVIYIKFTEPAIDTMEYFLKNRYRYIVEYCEEKLRS